MVGKAVEDQVVVLPTLGEILLGVIDHVICADGSDHVHIIRCRYASHICAERLGDLHSERTNTSPCAVNQDFLSRLNLSLIAKTLQCGECRYGHRSCLLKRDILRLQDQRRLGSARILGKCPLEVDPGFYTGILRITDTDAEDLVAGLKLGYVSADCLNLTRQVNTWASRP